jgi:hypothetical protein
MPWRDFGVLAAVVLAALWVYVYEAEAQTDANVDADNPNTAV